MQGVFSSPLIYYNTHGSIELKTAFNETAKMPCGGPEGGNVDHSDCLHRRFNTAAALVVTGYITLLIYWRREHHPVTTNLDTLI